MVRNYCLFGLDIIERFYVFFIGEKMLRKKVLSGGVVEDLYKKNK